MDNYKKLLEERRIWYTSIKKVYCPILKEYIVFNSKGFHHLIYPNGKRRPQKEQMYKLGLLPLIIPVIKNSTKISKYEKCFVKDLGKEAEFCVLTFGLWNSLAETNLSVHKHTNMISY